MGDVRPIRPVALLLLAALLCAPTAFPADAPDAYTLYRVASASGGLGRAQQPREIVIDSDGGRIVAVLPYGSTCKETLTFRWRFNKDIRYLRAGESFTMTLWTEVDGNCDERRNAYLQAKQNFASFGPLFRARVTEADYSANALKIEGRLHRVYGKPIDARSPDAYRTKSYTCTATTDTGPTERLWFGLGMDAFSPSGEAFTWQVAYFFRGTTDGRPSGDEIRYDNPGPNSKTTVGTETGPSAASPPDDATPRSSVTPPAATRPPEPRVSPSDGERTLLAEKRRVAEGQRVVVPVRLLSPDGVANIDYTVTYDPTVVVPDGAILKGSLLGGARMEANPAEPGIVQIAFAQRTGLSTDGIVANLVFRAVGRPGDATDLGLAVTDIDDERGSTLPIRRIAGRIEIVGPDASVRGDCDYDDELTMADVICALQMAVGLMEVDLNVDVTRDGRVTSGDARQILQMIP